MPKTQIDKKTMALVVQDFLDFNADNHLGWEKFTEVCNKKYGLAFGSSAYRKRITTYLEAKDFWLNDKEKRYSAIESKELKLINKQKELTKLNTLLNKAKNDFNNITDYKSIIEKIIPPSKNYIQKIDYEKREGSNVFVLSDLQCDGNGWTREVYQFCLDSILKIVKNENLNEIWVIDNGDIIDNNLRVSSLIDNKPFVSQLVEVQQNLASFLEELSRHVRVNFSIINSNHLETRLFGFKAGETKQFDLTIVILEYLKSYLRKNENIKFLNNVEKPTDLNYNNISIEGYNLLHTHGDMKAIKINNPKQSMSNLRDYLDEEIDYLLVGHMHHMSVTSINLNRRKGGNKTMIWVPALDPRQSKENEFSLGLSSAPAFTRLKLEKEKGLTTIETIPLPKILWR